MFLTASDNTEPDQDANHLPGRNHHPPSSIGWQPKTPTTDLSGNDVSHVADAKKEHATDNGIREESEQPRHRQVAQEAKEHAEGNENGDGAKVLRNFGDGDTGGEDEDEAARHAERESQRRMIVDHFKIDEQAGAEGEEPGEEEEAVSIRCVCHGVLLLC